MPNPFVPAFTFDRIERHFKKAKASIFADGAPISDRLQGPFEHFQQALATVYQEAGIWGETDFHNILNALEFAARKHQGQARDDKARTPYIVHPISVAVHILEVGKTRDVDTVIASLLHDTLEDTSTTFSELASLFGSRAASIVQEVSDDKQLPKEERKRLQFATAPLKGRQAAEIKLADKWANLSDLLNHPPISWSQERIFAYFIWSKQVVDALPRINSYLLDAAQEVIAIFFAGHPNAS